MHALKSVSLSTLVFLAALGLSPVSARAALVTWYFDGVVTVSSSHASQLGSLGVVDGTQFFAAITFDNSVAASDPSVPPVNGCCGRYADPVLSIDFQSGSYVAGVSAESQSEIWAPYGFAYFSIEAAPTGSWTLESPRFWLQMTATYDLNGIGLPVAPSIYAATTPTLFVHDDSGEVLRAVAAHYSYSVPEASALLFLAGFATAFAAARARP